MRNAVIIKGNKYGFQIVLQAELAFDELQQELARKFEESRRFFDQSKAVAISFEGRSLTEEEQIQLVDTIVDHSGLQIAYIVDGAKTLETKYAALLSKYGTGDRSDSRSSDADLADSTSSADSSEEAETELSSSGQRTEKNGQFYRGTLRSGQSIEVDGSIVILGDINPGAQVIAGGNVVVLGCVKGTITAGYPSDRSAVVAALMMEPMQIKIGDIIARSPDHKAIKMKKKLRKKQVELEPKLAFVEKDNIFIETITRELISEFSSI